MSQAKQVSPRQQQLMQKYRHGIQCFLPGEKIISEFTPKNKDPFWQRIYSLGLAVATLIAIGPMIINNIYPISYWYAYIIAGFLFEMLVLSTKEKIPELSEYTIYLTDQRVISQRVTANGRVLSEKDIPRKKIQEYHISELGFPQMIRKKSHLVFFFGLILLLVPFQYVDLILGWVYDRVWEYIIAIIFYELICLFIWLSYFKSEKEIIIDRDFAVDSTADKITPPPGSGISKNFSGPALNNYCWLLGNLSNRNQQSQPSKMTIQKTDFLAKNMLDIDSKEFFDVAENYSKNLMQTPLRNLVKGTAIDVGFILGYIISLLLNRDNSNPYSEYGMYIFYGLLGLMIIKFFIFLSSMVKFSIHMMQEDPSTILGNLPVIRPGYHSFTTFIRLLSLSIGLFYYTGSQDDLIPVALAVGIFFIAAYLIGGIVYFIILAVLYFPYHEQYTSAYFSGNSILLRKFVEKILPINKGGQLSTLTYYDNLINMFYNTRLTETQLYIGGNFNRDFRKIIEFEYKIYYLVFLVTLFSVALLFPELFTTWAPTFASWANLAKSYLLTLIAAQSEFQILEVVGFFIFVIQIIIVFYFSKVLRHFLELREPNLSFQFNRNFPLFMKSNSIQNSIDIAWNIRDILTSGKEEYYKRAESYYSAIKNAPRIPTSAAHVKPAQSASQVNPPSRASIQKSSPSQTPTSSQPSQPSQPIQSSPPSSPFSTQASNVGISSQPSGQRPTPLHISQIQSGPVSSPIKNPSPFSSPYPVAPAQPTVTASTTSVDTSVPKSAGSVDMTTLIPNQIGKQEELRASTEFVQVDRQTPYMKAIDLAKPANFYLFQIDTHRPEIESQIAWDSDEPLIELNRFTGLTSEQKNNLISYLEKQPFEVQQRVVHILHYLFLTNNYMKK
jgi:hypothetical protein